MPTSLPLYPSISIVVLLYLVNAPLPVGPGTSGGHGGEAHVSVAGALKQRGGWHEQGPWEDLYIYDVYNIHM